jgi:hypothetical protein
MSEHINEPLVRAALTFLLMVTFSLAMIALFYVNIPEKNENAIMFMLGQLSGFCGGMIAVYAGTTASSARKDKIIADLSARDK